MTKRQDYYRRRREVVLAVNARSRAKNSDRIADAKRAAYLLIKDDPEFKKKCRARSEANKDAKREYDRAYRARNAERISEVKAIWRAANLLTIRLIRSTYKAKRRAKVSTGATSAEVRDWLALQDKICRWCGVDCEDEFHIDHVVPLARGGQHQIENMTVACPDCNVRKNARDPAEFSASVGASL